jgi:hypothetical protein
MLRAVQKLFGIALCVVALLGGFCVWQRFELKNDAQIIAKLKADLQAQKAELEKTRESAAALTQQKQWLDQESQTLRKKIETLHSAAPAVASASPTPAQPGAKSKGAGMKEFLAKMMSDPDMKEAMRKQTRVFLQTSYASLFKELGLTPEQTDQLLDMLADRQLKMTESSSALFGDQANKADAAKAIADQRKAADEQIRQFLGDANFQKLEKWETSLGTRMQVDQFKQRLAGGSAPLQDFQSQQLGTIMAEEATRATPQMSADEISRVQKGDPTALMSEEGVNRMLAHQTEVNQRVLDRARGFLTPEQLKSLGELQAQQLEMQKFGLKMAAKMFGGEGEGGADGAPVQAAPVQVAPAPAQ